MTHIVDMMLVIGARIGEILALRWTDIDLSADKPTATIDGTVKTERDKGTHRKPTPETDASVRTVALPDFTVELLQRRRAANPGRPEAPVFPTRSGTWKQVTNVERDWRRIRQDTGSDWVTPHTFRNTVATLIAERVDGDSRSTARTWLVGHHAPVLHLKSRDHRRRGGFRGRAGRGHDRTGASN